MKDIKLDLNKWRDVACSWIRKCNIVKMSILPKLLYRFNVISVKITAIFFCRYIQADYKLHMENKGTRIAKTVLKRKSKGREISLHNFQIL